MSRRGVDRRRRQLRWTLLFRLVRRRARLAVLKYWLSPDMGAREQLRWLAQGGHLPLDKAIGRCFLEAVTAPRWSCLATWWPTCERSSPGPSPGLAGPWLAHVASRQRAEKQMFLSCEYVSSAAAPFSRP